MITDKVLVFFPYALDKNAGGPSGFIAQNLTDKPKVKFVLYDDLYKKSLLFFLKRHWFYQVRARLDDSVKAKFKDNQFYYWLCNCKQFKIIYFHDCLTMASCLHLLSPKQIVVLQSHSPQPPSEEAMEMGADAEMVDYLRYAERVSFERANYIVMPNEHVLPLYEKLIPDQRKVYYLLSGCSKPKNFTKHALNDQAVNFLFIGRRSAIKGFDIVIKAFEKACQIKKDIRLIVVGKGKKIVHPAVDDVGFSNNPGIWYNSVDYVVNANRQSYFDLSVMETIAAGTPVILKPSHGHKYFMNKMSGIICFDSEQDLVNIFINSGKTTENKKLRNELKSLFEKEFSDDSYFRRFEKFASEMIALANL